MKVCKACGLEKPRSEFYKRATSADGLHRCCKPCVRAESKRWREANPERAREAIKRWNENNPDRKNTYSRNWRANNPDKARAVDAAKYQSRKKEHAKLTAEWRAKHPGYGAERYAARKNDPEFLAARVAAVLKYKTAKLDRMPSWVANDPDMVWMIEEAYHLAKLREEVVGGKWHVDHVVPLRGKKVSGLHVPWNLQVIPAKENIRKSNRFETE